MEISITNKLIEFSFFRETSISPWMVLGFIILDLSFGACLRLFVLFDNPFKEPLLNANIWDNFVSLKKLLNIKQLLSATWFILVMFYY